MLVSRVYLHEQRKQSFLTLAKENQSPLGLDKNLPTFLFTNPQFVLLIHALHFLFSPCFRYLSRNASSSARTSWAYHSKMKWDIKKKKKVFQKCMDLLYGAVIHSPELWGTFYYGCAHFIWRIVATHPPTAMIMLGRAREISISIWICLKE